MKNISKQQATFIGIWILPVWLLLLALWMLPESCEKQLYDIWVWFYAVWLAFFLTPLRHLPDAIENFLRHRHTAPETAPRTPAEDGPRVTLPNRRLPKPRNTAAATNTNLQPTGEEWSSTSPLNSLHRCRDHRRYS